MTDYISTGIILGLSAGFAPGPLLTLVISETLQHGIKSGIRVALSPIITDLPIILLSLFILGQLAEFQNLLGIISLIGGGVILYMGYETMTARPPKSDCLATAPKSLLKGILVNALSPHPYIFWLSVGGTLMNKALTQSAGTLVGFVGSFYLFLVGSKILIAILVGRSRQFLTSRWYVYTLRVLGMALCLLALFLFHEGLVLLGVLGF
jgi:threonine/homoserine/homoserine lactone efflux protein